MSEIGNVIYANRNRGKKYFVNRTFKKTAGVAIFFKQKLSAVFIFSKKKTFLEFKILYIKSINVECFFCSKKFKCKKLFFNITIEETILVEENGNMEQEEDYAEEEVEVEEDTTADDMTDEVVQEEVQDEQVLLVFY